MLLRQIPASNDEYYLFCDEKLNEFIIHASFPESI